MDQLLFTSSSESQQIRKRIPWAFFLSLLLLLVLEVVIRLTVPINAYPYDDDDQEYRAFQYYLDHLGPADVCFLGSSRGREAIVVPEVSRLLDEGGIKGLRVANYSLASCLATEANSIVRQIVRMNPKPRLIVYGITPAQLLNITEAYRNSSLLWDVRDWLHFYRMRGKEVLRYLPNIMRNQIRRSYETFRWREGIPYIIRNLFRPRPPISNPFIGQLTVWQRDLPEQVFSPGQGFDTETLVYLKDIYKDGVDWMGETQQGSLEDLARQCRDANVPLIFVELQLTSYFRPNYPGDVYNEFMSFFQAIADRYDARFLTLEELGLHLDDSEFRDSEHTNFRGALHVTRTLTCKALLPFLSNKSAQLEDPRAPCLIRWNERLIGHDEAFLTLRRNLEIRDNLLSSEFPGERLFHNVITEGSTEENRYL